MTATIPHRSPGYLPAGDALADLLDDAGLTGRGGAAFSTATKLRAAAHTRAPLIVNACDGELGAAKDAWVVAHHLEELVAGAALISPRVRFAAHRGSETARRLTTAGVRVLEVPHRYVSSEESALLSLASGGLARPLSRTAPITSGARRADGSKVPATLVLNAETVWRAYQIATKGVRWYRSFGTPEEPGPRLVTVGGAVGRGHPLVLETESGARLASLLETAGGTWPGVSSLALNGLGGRWMPWTSAERNLPWSSRALAPFGIRTGAGILWAIDPHRCPLEVLDEWVGYAAGESAGQCGPCLFGVPAVAADVSALARRKVDRGLAQRLGRRLGWLPGRGACRFPDGVSGHVSSALAVHSEHVSDHLRGVCSYRPPRRRGDR
ncbi:NADH-ubiquinone oxidoreductase-F iron-sulfur binding region domain-containing protein [Janibacter sp. GXQ6167]|uniref:NADH-ubiquinone oxidoreductase-F iron-sulfur binding region domain-containing protein n=1 Tax=Janibacter sp. GXQ6167 TaxID=3240791 RepID=UPI003524AEA2